jgi:hypothetical protein
MVRWSLMAAIRQLEENGETGRLLEVDSASQWRTKTIGKA